MEARIEKIEKSIELIKELLMNNKKTLTLEELCKYSGYTEGYIYKLTSTRQIPHYKSNRKIYFDKGEIDTWLRRKKIQDMHSEVVALART